MDVLIHGRGPSNVAAVVAVRDGDAAARGAVATPAAT
eukprot:SAG25_NODE_7697_length_465_cov_0.849727_1_plen_36_part_10